MRVRRLFALLALTIALVFGAASPASAHAQLVDTTPASGAEIATAPHTATLHFSEGVRLITGGIRLLDENGQRLQLPTPNTTGSSVNVSLPAIGPGAYVVTWRVVSDDGHPVRGAFTFRVGGKGSQQVAAKAATSLFASEKGRSDVGAVSALLRALTFAAMVGLIGIAGLLVFAAAKLSELPRRRLRRLATALTGLAVASGVGALLIYGPYVTGSGFGALTDGVLLDDTLRDSIGQAIVGRTILLLLLGLAVREVLRASAPRRSSGLFTGGLIVALGIVQAFTGHGAVGRWTAVSVVATAVHVVAAGLWVGGLAALIAAGLGSQMTADERAAILRRFSTVALWSVAAIVTSGVFASLRQVGTIRALTTTTMGKLLIAKVGLVALMVALGARNRRKLADDVAETATAAVARRVRLESVLSIGVLVFTTLLTGTAPARDLVARPVSVTMRAETVLVDLTIDPARRGRNDIHLYVLRPDGLPQKVVGITATASLPAKGVEGLPLTMLRAGSNHFQVLGADLPLSGTWRIDAKVRVDEFTEESASTSVTIR